MPAKIQSAFVGVTDSRIQEFERKHHLQLPDDYRTFLKTSNGGVPDPKTFHVPALKQDILVDIFFGVDLESDLNLETWLHEYKDEMPTGFLIVGADPGSNLLLLADGQVETGIFYWDHTFFFKQSSEEENTYPLATSFSEFLSNLR